VAVDVSVGGLPGTLDGLDLCLVSPERFFQGFDGGFHGTLAFLEVTFHLGQDRLHGPVRQLNEGGVVLVERIERQGLEGLREPPAGIFHQRLLLDHGGLRLGEPGLQASMLDALILHGAAGLVKLVAEAFLLGP